jgi:hypothetical protein
MAMLCGRVICVKKVVENHDEDSVTMDSWDELVGASETSEEITTDGFLVISISSESE